MATAMNNLREWRERARDRRDHDPVPNSDEENHPLAQSISPQSEAGSDPQGPPDSEETRSIVQSVSGDGEDGGDDGDGAMEDVDIERQGSGETAATEMSTSENNNNGTVTATTTSRRTMSIRDLEEERELARRRTSACVMLAMFILFRLWIQALATGDLGLLMLCLVGSSWTARFMRHTREREEELDRLIQQYAEASADGNGGGEGVSRRDIQRLSFQAQLAYAIMESQREMMNGGYGNGDQHGGAGVTDEAKEHWNRFHWKNAEASKVGYGSVQEADKLSTPTKEEDEPHCSICLVEYEEDEELVALPCKHVYHEDCVASWCQNHTRCPLCNFDLESVLENAPESV